MTIDSDAEIDVTIDDLMLLLLDDGLYERLQFEPVRVQLAALESRVVEQVLYQLVHLVGRSLDRIQERTALIIELVFMIFQQQPAVTVDAAKRSFQVVRNRIRERFELAGLCIECRGACGNPFLELGVELSQQFSRAFATPALD
jgi:hypothetical protein